MVTARWFIRVKNAITAAVKKNVTPAINGFPAADKLILNFKLPTGSVSILKLVCSQKLTNMQPQQQHQPYPVRMKTLVHIYFQDLIRDIWSFQLKNSLSFRMFFPLPDVIVIPMFWTTAQNAQSTVAKSKFTQKKASFHARLSIKPFLVVDPKNKLVVIQRGTTVSLRLQLNGYGLKQFLWRQLPKRVNRWFPMKLKSFFLLSNFLVGNASQ